MRIIPLSKLNSEAYTAHNSYLLNGYLTQDYTFIACLKLIKNIICIFVPSLQAQTSSYTAHYEENILLTSSDMQCCYLVSSYHGMRMYQKLFTGSDVLFDHQRAKL